MDRRAGLLLIIFGIYVTTSGAKPYHNKKNHVRTKPFRDEYQGLPSDPFANLPAVPVKPPAQFMSWDPKNTAAHDKPVVEDKKAEAAEKTTVIDQDQLKEIIKKDACKYVFCHEGRVCEVSPTGLGQCVCAPDDHCKGHKKEVCGTDGNTYPSHCELHRAACIKDHHVGVDHSGKACGTTTKPKDQKKATKHKKDKSPAAPTSESCGLEVQPGPCKGYFPKWYYDGATRKCRSFIYGGCRGNSNQFGSQDECEDTCIIREREFKDIVMHKKMHRRKGSRGHKMLQDNSKDVIPTPPPSTLAPTSTPSSTTLETEDVDLDAQSAQDMQYLSTQTTDLCTDLEYERLKAELLCYHCERIEESDCRDGIKEKQLVANIMLNYYDRDSDGHLTETELDDIEHRDHLDKLNRYCSLTDMLTYDDSNEDDVIDSVEFFKAFRVPRVVLEDHLRVFSTQVTAGNSIELKCDITGGEAIIWKRNGASLEQVTTNDIKTFEDGSLYISNLGLHHMGNYTCQDINEDTVIQTHVLRVQLPPQVKVSPSTQFHTSGVTVKLKCHADGIPQPEIMWEKNEAPLPEIQEAGHYVRLYNNRTLEIKNAVYTRDTGAYKCKARNSAGVGQDIATVFIENSHVPTYQSDMYEVFVVFHDKGYTVYEPAHCHLEHQVTGAFNMFKILPEYGDTLSSLCPVNSNCSWGSAVNVRNKFIYITQPEQNRVVVIEIQDRSNPVEVIPTDKTPVAIHYVEHLDQVWVLCWNGVSDSGSKTTVVIRQASEDIQHHTVHTQPIANRFDLVKEVYLPTNNDLHHKFVHGYVVHQDQKDLYKLDLQAMKYVKTIDLGNYDCVPHSVAYVPLGGQVLVHCKAGEGEIETNSLLVLDYVTDQILEQRRLNGDPYVSPDSRFMVVVDDDGDTITVHRINDEGKIEKLYDEYTNLHVSDVAFFPSDRGHGYDLYATSTNRNEVLYMNLASGKVEMIDGVGEAIKQNEWRWSKRNRVIVGGGVFGEYLMTPSHNSVVVIDGQRRHVQCEWQEIAHGNIIVWVEPLHL